MERFSEQDQGEFLRRADVELPLRLLDGALGENRALARGVRRAEEIRRRLQETEHGFFRDPEIYFPLHRLRDAEGAAMDEQLLKLELYLGLEDVRACRLLGDG